MKKLIFTLFLLISAMSFSQVKVSGFVKDIKGEPIPFADIYFKGSTKGAVSDENGKFYLESDKSYSILVINFLGFDRKEIPLKARNFDITIVLKESAAQLDAVEIYSGKIKKKGNPAIALLKKIWKHKRKNGIYLFDQY